MIDYREEYERWLNSKRFDKDTIEELKELTDEREIQDRFYKELTFGTGGLRGILGAGTNRMNFYTVGKASQGLSDYLNSVKENACAVIAFDSRRNSDKFALDTALIFAANGIKAYLFESLRPTPELSFAVRELNADAGVVITASHNPPEYNGYKVYLSDGAQIVPPYDKLIIERVGAVEDYRKIKRITRKEAEDKGLLSIIGKEIDDKYTKAVKSLTLNPSEIEKAADKLKIVYSPLCGTGKVPVLRVLDELGFKNVYTVPEQTEPDGNFPTLKYPNPEDHAAFELAIKLAHEKQADIILATDPDADRLGIYALDQSGSYLPFTGNMSGLLILEYRLAEMEKQGLLPENLKDAAIVTTIVSSDMAKAIADEYGVTLIETLTGFKYIGEKINQFEVALKENGGKFDRAKGAYQYIFGFEESYGCLVGTHARDKDAVAAVTALCEAAAYYKNRGLTLVDVMEHIYKKYGYYREGLVAKTLTGVDGAEKIKAVMNRLKVSPPSKIGGEKVVKLRDYSMGIVVDVETGKKIETGLPFSQVLYFELEDCSWCCIRPSGTEPKIKYYFGALSKDVNEADKKLKKIEKDLLNLV